MKRFLIIACFAFLCGCGDADSKNRLDGEIVKTQDNRFFTVHHHLMDTYFIRPIDVDEIKNQANYISGK